MLPIAYASQAETTAIPPRSQQVYDGAGDRFLESAARHGTPVSWTGGQEGRAHFQGETIRSPPALIPAEHH